MIGPNKQSNKKKPTPLLLLCVTSFMDDPLAVYFFHLYMRQKNIFSPEYTYCFRQEGEAGTMAQTGLCEASGIKIN